MLIRTQRKWVMAPGTAADRVNSLAQSLEKEKEGKLNYQYRQVVLYLNIVIALAEKKKIDEEKIDCQCGLLIKLS